MALGETLDAERVVVEKRTRPIGEAEDLMPFVDEAVQDAAAAPAQGHPHGNLGVRADAPRDVQVEGMGLGIDEEPPVVRHLTGDVLDPAERVAPERPDPEGPAAAGNGVRADGGQGQARLGEDVLVAELDRSLGLVERGGLLRRSRRRGQQAGEKSQAPQASPSRSQALPFDRAAREGLESRAFIMNWLEGTSRGQEDSTPPSRPNSRRSRLAPRAPLRGPQTCRPCGWRVRDPL